MVVSQLRLQMSPSLSERSLVLSLLQIGWRMPLEPTCRAFVVELSKAIF